MNPIGNFELITIKIKNSSLVCPVENLWGYLVCGLNNARTAEGGHLHARDAANADELFNIVNQKWEEVKQDMNYLQSLVESMPRRLQAVIDAQGGWTKY